MADYLGLVALVRDLEHRLGRERRRSEAIKTCSTGASVISSGSGGRCSGASTRRGRNCRRSWSRSKWPRRRGFTAEACMSLTRSALGAKASRSGRRMRPALVVVKGKAVQ